MDVASVSVGVPLVHYKCGATAEAFHWKEQMGAWTVHWVLAGWCRQRNLHWAGTLSTLSAAFALLCFECDMTLALGLWISISSTILRSLRIIKILVIFQAPSLNCRSSTFEQKICVTTGIWSYSPKFCINGSASKCLDRFVFMFEHAIGVIPNEVI